MLMTSPAVMTQDFRNVGVLGKSDLPEALRDEDMRLTGKYVHVSNQALDITHMVNGVQRNFKLVLALGTVESQGYRFDRNGIAVIDTDQGEVITDGIVGQPSGIKGASADQMTAMGIFAKADWSLFATLLRDSDNYRANVANDIDSAPVHIVPGPARMKPAFDHASADIRCSPVRDFHDSGEYDLPARSRKAMINEIIMRPCVEIGGKSYLSWNVRMDFAWDRSCRGSGIEFTSDLDGKWAKAMKGNHDLLLGACEKAIAPYLDEPFDALGLGDAACDLALAGQGYDKLAIQTFSGRSMGFASVRELRESLDVLDDDTLSIFWATTRILDKDLGRQARAELVVDQLSLVREKLESEWLIEVEEEITM